MDLKIYNRDGLWERRKELGICTINFYHGGRVRLNAGLIKALNLNPGDRIIMAQDLDSRNDWYIGFLQQDSTEGYRLNQLRQKYPDKSLGATYSKEAVNTILDSVSAEISATFLVGTSNPKLIDGMTWYRLLTTNPVFIR